MGAKRRRLVPGGTVGGRIAGARTPAFSNCAARASAGAASPTTVLPDEDAQSVADLVIAPIGFVLRHLVRDPLDRSLTDGKASNWIKRERQPVDPARYQQQF